MSFGVNVPGCDAPEPRPVYLLWWDDGVPVFGCRCVVCPGNCELDPDPQSDDRAADDVG